MAICKPTAERREMSRALAYTSGTFLSAKSERFKRMPCSKAECNDLTMVHRASEPGPNIEGRGGYKINHLIFGEGGPVLVEAADYRA